MSECITILRITVSDGTVMLRVRRQSKMKPIPSHPLLRGNKYAKEQPYTMQSSQIHHIVTFVDNRVI
jgi:hypothetical protein